MGGAWVLRGSLNECVRRCTCCARCRWVSYSRVNADCSWFAECNASALLTSGPSQSYHTVEVTPRSGSSRNVQHDMDMHMRMPHAHAHAHAHANAHAYAHGHGHGIHMDMDTDMDIQQQ